MATSKQVLRRSGCSLCGRRRPRALRRRGATLVLFVVFLGPLDGLRRLGDRPRHNDLRADAGLRRRRRRRPGRRGAEREHGDEQQLLRRDSRGPAGVDRKHGARREPDNQRLHAEHRPLRLQFDGAAVSRAVSRPFQPELEHGAGDRFRQRIQRTRLQQDPELVRAEHSGHVGGRTPRGTSA